MADTMCVECGGGSPDEIHPCDRCGEALCIECAVSPSPPSPPVEGHRCSTCHEAGHIAAAAAWQREEDSRLEEKARKDARNKAARERYRRPENVAKRKAAREALERKRAEIRRRSWAAVAEVLAEIMPNSRR